MYETHIVTPGKKINKSMSIFHKCLTNPIQNALARKITLRHYPNLITQMKTTMWIRTWLWTTIEPSDQLGVSSAVTLSHRFCCWLSPCWKTAEESFRSCSSVEIWSLAPARRCLAHTPPTLRDGRGKRESDREIERGGDVLLIGNIWEALHGV